MPGVNIQGTTAAALLLSFGLVVLVAAAITGQANALFFTIVAAALIPGFMLHRLFPSTRWLWIAFIHLVAAYAAVFSVFVAEAFTTVDTQTLAMGFAAPILTFLARCWIDRGRLAEAMANPAFRSGHSLSGSLLWMAPVATVGVSVIALSQIAPQAFNDPRVFTLAMLGIGGIVFAVGRSVAMFFVEIGWLFDEFVQRIRHLLVPASAFLTVYTLIVIVFAAGYTLASKLGAEDHFRIGGAGRALTFPEALHFSITTLSTVGYGDIVPVSNLGRSLAAIQVVIGTLLLLFGVSEILEYARERRRRDRNDTLAS